MALNTPKTKISSSTELSSSCQNKLGLYPPTSGLQRRNCFRNSSPHSAVCITRASGVVLPSLQLMLIWRSFTIGCTKVCSMRCDIASLVKWFPTFRRNVLPSFSEAKWNNETIFLGHHPPSDTASHLQLRRCNNFKTSTTISFSNLKKAHVGTSKDFQNTMTYFSNANKNNFLHL
jgi:hypothetical protein